MFGFLVFRLFFWEFPNTRVAILIAQGAKRPTFGWATMAVH